MKFFRLQILCPVNGGVPKESFHCGFVFEYACVTDKFFSKLKLLAIDHDVFIVEQTSLNRCEQLVLLGLPNELLTPHTKETTSYITEHLAKCPRQQSSAMCTHGFQLCK